MTDIIDMKISRLLGGGAFDTPAANVRSASRDWDAPMTRDTDNGFRLARTYH